MFGGFRNVGDDITELRIASQLSWATDPRSVGDRAIRIRDCAYFRSCAVLRLACRFRKLGAQFP